MGKTKKSIRRRVCKRVTCKRVSHKNKKTRRIVLKQTGGRSRPNGNGTAGAAASASANNDAMNQGGPDYLNEEEKAEAIGLIQANNLEGLRSLLGARTFPDDKALMEAVTMSGANIQMISEVIFKTYIHGDTEDKISAAMEETPDLLIEVIDALKQQELRQEEAAALALAIESLAKNNGRPSTPPPPMKN